MKDLLSIHAGETGLRESVKAILTILAVEGHEGETIRKALEVLKEISSINNVTISGCNFQSGVPSPAPKRKR